MHTPIITEAQKLSPKQIEEICTLLNSAYHNSKMAKVFMEGLTKKDMPQLCGFILNAEDKIIAFRTMKPHKSILPLEVTSPYGNIYGKHLVVHPSTRGENLGRMLVKELNQEGAKFFNTDIIWGTSAEIGAMRLYKRMGARFYLPSVFTNSPKISGEANLECFKGFMETPALNKWRLINDIGFAYAFSPKAEAYLEEHQFQKFA